MHSPAEKGVIAAHDLVEYLIKVGVTVSTDKPPRVEHENLTVSDRKSFDAEGTLERGHIKTVVRKERGTKGHSPATVCRSDTPVLLQLAQNDMSRSQKVAMLARTILRQFESIRFLDLSPLQMRIPSFPGQDTLGDRGENLSSVLAAIWTDASKKETVLEWVRRLTPMDVDDLEFEQDAGGRILLSLVEKNGQKVSAMSASDGTLRFLAILAALFGPAASALYFIEEIENGIHPTRLSLLVDLIEHQTKRRGIQIVATSHSPQLLQLLSDESLETTSLVYRLPDHPDARIKPILEIPNARRVIKEQPVWVLHASSWFEDVVYVTEGAQAEPISGNQPAS